MQVLHRNISTPLEIQLSISPCIAQAQTELFIVSRAQQHSTENACHPTDVTITNLIQVAIRCVSQSRKQTSITFGSVRQSVRMLRGSQWTDLPEILYWEGGYYENLSTKAKVGLKSDQKNIGHFT